MGKSPEVRNPTRRTVLAGLAAASAAPLGGCGYFTGIERSITLRQTLSVQTPGGVRQSTTVSRIDRRRGAKIWGTMDSGSTRVYGQALAIDTGANGALFGLMEDPAHDRGISGIVSQAIAGKGIDQQPAESYERWDWIEAFDDLKDREVTGRVLAENLPMFVWVPNLADPTQAQELTTDFFGAISPGFRFLELDFAVVPDSTPITVDLRTRYPTIFRQMHLKGPLDMENYDRSDLLRRVRTDHFLNLDD